MREWRGGSWLMFQLSRCTWSSRSAISWFERLHSGRASRGVSGYTRQWQRAGTTCGLREGRLIGADLIY
jgi:hypothetical protein